MGSEIGSVDSSQSCSTHCLSPAIFNSATYALINRGITPLGYMAGSAPPLVISRSDSLVGGDCNQSATSVSPWVADSQSDCAASSPVTVQSFMRLPLCPCRQTLLLDGSTASFSLKPDATQLGAHEITFRAQSNSGESASETIQITVMGSPPNQDTVLSGRLLDTNDFVQGKLTPVVGATVSILDSGISVRSDRPVIFRCAVFRPASKCSTLRWQSLLWHRMALRTQAFAKRLKSSMAS